MVRPPGNNSVVPQNAAPRGDLRGRLEQPNSNNISTDNSVIPQNVPRGDLRERLEQPGANEALRETTPVSIKNDPFEEPGTERQKKKVQKTNRKTKKKEVKKETKPNIEFDDQSFLWDFIDEFENIDLEKRLKKAQKARAGTDPVGEESGKKFINSHLNNKPPILYKNFLQIEDDEPLTTSNKLLADGVSSLNEMTTAQLSSIVPRFKLFKVLTDEGDGTRKRIEFPFNKFTTVESIVSSREGRGTDAGFMSVDWDDTSGNPGNAGLSFKGNMKLHFQSFEGIFKVRTVDGEKIAFADILHLQSAKGKQAKKNEKSSELESANETNINCGRAPEIHMECGWSLPPNNISTQDLRDKLLDMRRTYVITPIEQQLDFEPNGAVNLTVEFAAAIEGRSFSVQSDLLGIDEANTKFNYVGIESNVSKVKESLKKERDAIRKRKKAIRELQKDKASAKKNANQIKKLKDLNKQVAETIQNTKSQIKEVRYARFLNLIRSGTKNRIFYFDINKESYDQYKNFLKFQAEEYGDIRGEKNKEERKKLQEDYRAEREKFVKRIQAKLGPSQSGVANDSALTSKVKQNKEAKNKNNKEKDATKLVDGKYRINYIFLGDLLEAAMEIIYKNPDIINGKRAKNNPKCPTVRTDLRLCLGSFSYVHPSTGKLMSMAMADVPVSLNYFNSWWYDNVIKKNRQRYALRTFLRDFCGKLLNNVVSPKRYGGMPTRPFRFNVQSIFTKKNHPLDLEWNKGADKEKTRININEVFGKRGQKGKANQTSQWLYVYVQGGNTRNSKLNGKIDEDEKRNIPHYFVGASRGIIKNISFDKTKIPGKRESLLFKSVTDGTTNSNILFSDRYDSNVSLYGNPVFKPGMLIYIDPRSMGLGLSDRDPQPFMSDLGIGGYYRVIKVSNSLSADMFETRLDTVSELSSREIAKNRKGL